MNKLSWCLTAMILILAGSVWGANCGGVTACNCGDTVTSSYTMTWDLTGCNGTALNIAASDIILNCGGYLLGGNGTLNGVNIGYETYRNNIIVKNCNIKNFSSGFFVNGNDNTQQFNNNISNVDYGIRLLGSGNNLTFSNNSIYNSTYGIHMNQLFENSTFYNNYIFNSTRAFNLFNTALNNVIDGNTILESDAGIVSGAFRILNVTNNYMNSTTRTSNPGIVSSDDYCYNSIIKNNIIENYNKGIALSYCNNTKVYNNTLLNNSDGIYFKETNNTLIYNNTIIDSDIHGIFSIDGNVNVSVYKNYIENWGSSKYGIDYHNDGGTVVFHNGLIYDNTLLLTLSDISATFSAIYMNNVAGMNIYNNIMYDRGITINGGDDVINNVIYNNTFYKNEDGEIISDSANNSRYENNTIYSNSTTYDILIYGRNTGSPNIAVFKNNTIDNEFIDYYVSGGNLTNVTNYYSPAQVNGINPHYTNFTMVCDSNIQRYNIEPFQVWNFDCDAGACANQNCTFPYDGVNASTNFYVGKYPNIIDITIDGINNIYDISARWLSFIINETSTNYHLINFSNGGKVKWMGSSRKVMAIINTSISLNITTPNSICNNTQATCEQNKNGQLNYTLAPGERVFVFSLTTTDDPHPTTIPLTVTDVDYVFRLATKQYLWNQTGTGSVVHTPFTLIVGTRGFYEVLLSGIPQESTNAATYSTTAGIWGFRTSSDGPSTASCKSPINFFVEGINEWGNWIAIIIIGIITLVIVTNEFGFAGLNKRDIIMIGVAAIIFIIMATILIYMGNAIC